MTRTTNPNLLEVRNLCVSFKAQGAAGRRGGVVRAVRDVSFAIPEGTTLGLVGESGCGKSTLARAMLRLVEVDSGSIAFNGVDLLAARGGALRRLRRNIQMVFQDTGGSLNPRMTVGAAVAEPMTVHRIGNRRYRQCRVADLLERVGLHANDATRYPHAFSGGQRQRIAIARALALKPKLIVCDEPVSALDVSVQAQILNLLRELQDELGVTYLFIAHDLAVVRHISQAVAVMYLGRIVEQASAEALFSRPCHPYTISLLAAVPRMDRMLPTQATHSEPPSPFDVIPGCAFHPRCGWATEVCRAELPLLSRADAQSDEHLVACHHTDVVNAEARGALDDPVAQMPGR